MSTYAPGTCGLHGYHGMQVCPGDYAAEWKDGYAPR